MGHISLRKLTTSVFTAV